MVQGGINDNIIGPPGPLMHRHKIGPGDEALAHAGDCCDNIDNW